MDHRRKPFYRSIFSGRSWEYVEQPHPVANIRYKKQMLINIGLNPVAYVYQCM